MDFDKGDSPFPGLPCRPERSKNRRLLCTQQFSLQHVKRISSQSPPKLFANDQALSLELTEHCFYSPRSEFQFDTKISSLTRRRSTEFCLDEDILHHFHLLAGSSKVFNELLNGIDVQPSARFGILARRGKQDEHETKNQFGIHVRDSVRVDWRHVGDCSTDRAGSQRCSREAEGPM